MGGFGRGKVWLRVRTAVGGDSCGRRRPWAGTAVENGRGRGRPRTGTAGAGPRCGWVSRDVAICHWSLARSGREGDDHGPGGPWAGCSWVWTASAGGLAAGGDGLGRVRLLARTAKGAGVLVTLVKIKFKLHPQQLILKLITLYSPHSVIFNDFESLFFFN